MHVHDVQSLLALERWYQGPIDGDAGPQTWRSVEIAENRLRRFYVGIPTRWSKRRRLIGVGQAILADQGFEPGLVDGYAGPNTAEALIEWQSERSKVSSSLKRNPLIGGRGHPAQRNFPRQSDMEVFYGDPGGPQCTAGEVDLASPMLLAWN